MTRWFIALLWVALLMVIAVMVWPDAKTEATAKTKTVTKTDAKADVTTVAKIFETMVTNAEAIRQALCVALAPLAAYLVLYAFAVDGDEFIPLDWIAKLLWPFLYLFSLGRRTALMPRGTTARVLETIGWPLSIGAGVLSFFFKYLDRFPEVQRGLAAVLGFLCIAATMKGLRRWDQSPREPTPRTRRRALEELVFPAIWIVFVWAVAWAVVTEELTNFAQAGAIILFGTLALGFAGCGLTLLSRNQLFVVESHWGGLGGGVGGWRVSLPVVLLVTAAFFAGATVMVTRPRIVSSGTPVSKTEDKPSGKGNSSTATAPPNPASEGKKQ